MNFTPPPYNADIGPGGPDMNAKVGFARVVTSMKSKMSPFLGVGNAANQMQGTNKNDQQSIGGVGGMGITQMPRIASAQQIPLDMQQKVRF